MAPLFTCYLCLEFHNNEHNEHKLVITVTVVDIKRMDVIFGILLSF